MNIKEAKQEISNTLRAYLEKEEDGEYRYALVRQRPILLMGAPGIGKTAIMEQIAEENEVGLVAYTITHHTRQSAVGLPRIRDRVYDGKQISVTEYTMSEIIDSVYHCMEKTGKKEGILFIDEINCASETLAPTMLQFLQNKKFGTHKVPDGWIIVAAGNPPEYNKSVREFDIVTLDRLRRIDVDVDVNVWMEYAWAHQLHGAILSYLTIKPDRFYHVENTVDGKFFVTARGWEDLSELLKSYERLELTAGYSQILQFLQYEDTAREFSAYYQLYMSYGQDYHIPALVENIISEEEYEEVLRLAQQGDFEERFTVTGLLLDYLNQKVSLWTREDQSLRRLHELLVLLKKLPEGDSYFETLDRFAAEQRNSLKVRRDAGLLSGTQAKNEAWAVHWLEEKILDVKKAHTGDSEKGFAMLKEAFEKEVQSHKDETAQMSERLHHAFSFMEEAFGDGQEMVLFMTQLSHNEMMMTYISRNGCKKFFKYSEKLLYRQQEEQLQKECDNYI